MLHTNNPIIKHKVGLLNLAEKLGNISKACQVMGVSRETFYRYQDLVEQGGLDALVTKGVKRLFKRCLNDWLTDENGQSVHEYEFN